MTACGGIYGDHYGDGQEIEGSTKAMREIDQLGFDDLYPAAIDIVRFNQKPSPSFIQRRLRIGYNRAVAIIEQMEVDGLVTKANSAGLRKMVDAPPAPSPILSMGERERARLLEIIVPLAAAVDVQDNYHKLAKSKPLDDIHYGPGITLGVMRKARALLKELKDHHE